MAVQVLDTAPDFDLPAVVGNEIRNVKLSDYRGKWVVLFMWPADFSGVCSSEIPEMSRRLPEFEAMNTAVIGLNTDGVHSHRKWAAELGGVNFPLVADKSNKTAERYGVLSPAGTCLRGTFIIDPEGVVKWSMTNFFIIARNVDEIFRNLAALQSGGICLVNWKPAT